MVEIPSSALLASSIAPEVDFFSIGTNDLTQYTLAAERGNPSLSYLADAMHPAVLNLIQKVAEAAHQHSKWVGVCGELAGDPVAAPILVGLGVDELSMNAGAIPKVKALLRGLYLSDMQVWARQVLIAEDALSARELARSFVLPLT
jgi:phosphocarrier protein FPr